MKTRQLMFAGVLLAGLALAGCGEREDAQIARNDAGGLAEPARASTDSAPGDAVGVAREATEATRRVANEVQQAAQTAADQATDKVSDAMITTAVNAEFARDPALSTLQIDVDTDAGRVALRGTAPDEQARARAAQIASQVQGVVSVDNYITVQAKG
jgi:osmotically-inducible protein OsmY